MATVLFGWPLVSDNAALSGGSWLAGLPLGNLKTDLLAEVARSTTDANADTLINIDYGSAQAVSVVALIRHNMRSTALWRIRASASNTMSSPLLDTGFIAVWPVQWPVGALPAGHPNAATRLFTDVQIDARKRDAVYVLATEVTARYWRIEINETANTDTYVQIGRLMMAPRFQPAYNFSVGAEFGFDDGTDVGRSMSRVRYYDVRPVGRTLSMQFQNLTDVQAITVVRDMIEELGVAGQVYVVQDPQDTYNLQRRSFLANIRQLAPVTYAAAGYSSVPLMLDEVL